MGMIKPMVRGVEAAGAVLVVTMLVAGTLLAAVVASETKLVPIDGAPGDLFGSAVGNSVAPSGRTAVIGAHGDDDGGDRAGAVYIFHDDGTGWAEQAKLTASDGVPKDFFGLAVSISGDAVVVGSFFSDAPAEHSGSAYVYQRSGDTWIEEAKLVAADGAEGDLFGISVAISGDALVVGARDHDAVAPNSGAAYVFRYDKTGWTQEAELSASDGAADDFLGVRVAIDGDVVIAGAPTADVGGGDSGAAYVFRFDGTSWTQEAKLTAPDGGTAGDRFGSSVAINGDTAVVGAPHEGPGGAAAKSPFAGFGGTARGAAYVFRFDGTNWSHDTKLIPSDPKPKTRSGGSVSIRSDKIQEAKLVPIDLSPMSQFGGSVSISGDKIVVGTSRGDGGERDTGAAYVFQRTGTVWSAELKLLASDGEQGDGFGGSVSILQDTVFVGAAGDDDLGSAAGATYVYELTSSWDEPN